MEWAAVVLLVAAYYGWARLWLRPVAARLARLAAGAPAMAAGDGAQIARLVTATVAQALFLVLLLWTAGVDPLALFGAHFEPRLVMLGVLLGLGEMGAGALLCQIAVAAATPLAPARELARASDWSALVNGGWMAQFVRTRQVLSWPALMPLAALYIVVEETIFRGVVITVLLPLGAGVAWAASVALFVLAQVAPMPSWRAALFPVIGASLVGVVHGLLFIALPTLVPLVTAHLVMFLVPMARRP